MTSLEDIQNNTIGSKDWTKFGSKVGDPFLSVFNESIKKAVSAIEYEVGKSYNFTDEEFQYRIDVEQFGESPKYTFFIKPKHIVKVSTKKVRPEDESLIDKYLLVGTIVFILIELLVLLMGGVFQALLG